MQKDSIQYIKKLLADQQPMQPVPTEVQAKLHPCIKFRAVVFDIYGTMLISSSGDIDQTEIKEENLKEALEASGVSINGSIQEALSTILSDYRYTIRIFNEAARKNQVQYPEIDILSIWKIILIHSRRKGLIRFADDIDIKLLVCVFEFLSNKVYPMPGLKEVIKDLHDICIPLGIISNAQFYTPILMNYYLQDQILLNERIKGFDHDLTVFSYKYGKGKPDQELYGELVINLKRKYGIKPSEVLLVGNDMIKDIYGGNKAGFRTALFAGDKRSLRMYEGNKLVNGLKPDYIVTDLKQVLKIIS